MQVKVTRGEIISPLVTPYSVKNFTGVVNEVKKIKSSVHGEISKCAFMHVLAVSLAGGVIKILEGMMTERMQNYRDRMSEKGLVQVRVWLEKQDEEFVKYIAKFCREVREKKPRKRYGRRATERHISFAAWTWRHGAGSENSDSRTGFENLKAAGGRCGLRPHRASQKRSGVISNN